MRLGSKLLLAGIGVLALTGVAAAAGQEIHVIAVKLPDGSIDHIRYTGKTPPRLVFIPVSRVRVADRNAGERITDPFRTFDRMFAEMNRRTDAMLRQAAAMAAQARTAPDRVTTASAGSMPPGAVQFSSFSVATPHGVCSRSVQITSQGQGKPAKVVTQTSGDCGDVASVRRAPAPSTKKGATAAPTTAAPPADARDTI